jgi:hypothetical protein
MNKRTIKSVERRLLKSMREDEIQLKLLLDTETNGIPDQQLDGLMIKIEQFLGKIMVSQNKLMLLQDLKDK